MPDTAYSSCFVPAAACEESNILMRQVMRVIMAACLSAVLILRDTIQIFLLFIVTFCFSLFL